MAYIVSYDLHSESANYNALVEEIRSSTSWARIVSSAYIIDTDETAEELRDRLTRRIGNNDTLFICELRRNAAWRGLSSDVSNWIKNHL